MSRSDKGFEPTRKDLLRGFFGLAAAGALAMGAGPARAAEMSVKSLLTPIPKKGTRLILLGTAGGPVIRRFRSQPSSLIVVDGVPYMIDCGAGCLRQLTWAGFMPVNLEGIFVTHNHLDHNAELGTLISFDWIEGRKTKLPIYGPYGTTHMVKAALDYFSVSERIFSKEAHFAPPPEKWVDPHDIMTSGLVFQDSRIKVTAAENAHYTLFDAGKDKSFSYRFDTADRSIVFSGDTGPSEALTKLAKGADILVSEVIDAESAVRLTAHDSHLDAKGLKTIEEHMRVEHMPAEALGKIAAAAGVKMVVLTHIVPGMDFETNATRYTAGVRKHYDGPVIAGRDLLEL